MVSSLIADKMNIWQGKLLTIVACILVDQTTVLCQTKGNLGGGSKAAAQWSVDDCLCQCSTTSFIDKWGKYQGNCRRYNNSLIMFKL